MKNQSIDNIKAMKFRSCPAVHRPDKLENLSSLEEGEYCIGPVQDINGNSLGNRMWCVLPVDHDDEQFGSLRGLSLDRELNPKEAGWDMTGDIDCPSLTPSILYGGRNGAWHGYLTKGEWKACE